MVDKKKIRSRKPKIFSYACSFFSQRPDPNAPSFCVFSASVGDIREWADIERLSPGVPGIQRRQNVTKCRQITKFFEISPINTIPTALIIAFDADLVSEHKKKGKLQIFRRLDGRPKAGLVIDGQHRLLGISDFDKTVKVAVVGILNCDDIEKAFQFLVINNKGSKVSPNHIKALALTYKEKDLTERLKLARIVVDQDRLIHVGILNSSKDSPFFNRVDFPNTKGSLKKIVPEAFEKALQYIESLNLPKLDDADVQREVAPFSTGHRKC